MATKRKTKAKRDEEALQTWAEVVREAFLLARGTRLGELRGRRRERLIDERGLHPFSLVWGRAQVLLPAFVLDDQERGAAKLAELGVEILRSDLSGKIEIGPVEIRQAARIDAERIFREEIIEAWKEGEDRED